MNSFVVDTREWECVRLPVSVWQASGSWTASTRKITASRPDSVIDLAALNEATNWLYQRLIAKAKGAVH